MAVGASINSNQMIAASRIRFKRFYSFVPMVQKLFQEGRLEVDKSQEFAINYLGNLARSLERNQLDKNIWSVWPSNKGDRRDLKGAYIYGSAGSGKTMLMDLFYENVKINEKARYHYNQFMLRFHSRLKKFRAIGSEDPIKSLVDDYCKGMKLLCLDEFQVTDIADAMILRNLLSSFIKSGMIIVTTSNRHPDELYLNGIQRGSFLPCIELIKSSMEVINLSSETDYRTKIQSNTTGSNHFFEPINEETEKIIDDLFYNYCPNSDQLNINVMGRIIKVWQGNLGNCAKFSFTELFEESKSAADYIEICRLFPKIFIKNIPEFSVEKRNEIRRFITFIDQVYEAKNELFLQSQVNLIKNLDKLKSELSVSYDESFALNRTISRLKEIKNKP